MIFTEKCTSTPLAEIYRNRVSQCSMLIKNSEVVSSAQILELITDCHLFENTKGMRRYFRQVSLIIVRHLIANYRLPIDFRIRPAEIKWLLINRQTRPYFVQFFNQEISIQELNYLIKSEEGREKPGFDGLYRRI